MNSYTAAGLPEFERSPVVEVVLGIQFQPPPGFGVVHLGLLWQEFRAEFPKTETHTPLSPVIEQFGVGLSSAIEVGVEVIDVPPIPRLWMLNSAGTELIQVQQDRFIHNWRKVDGSTQYPRYRYLREQFIAELERFQRFLMEQGLGQLTPVQCEITYVDEIRAGEGWERHGQLDRVLTLWASHPEGVFPPEPENVQLVVRYVLTDEVGDPLGRLHIAVTPAYRVDSQLPVLMLNCTARGRPEGQGIEGVLRFLDRGHDWLVRTFVSITTSEMHTIWRKRDGSPTP